MKPPLYDRRARYLQKYPELGEPDDAALDLMDQNAEASARVGGQHLANGGLAGVTARALERLGIQRDERARSPARQRPRIHAADVPMEIPKPHSGAFHAGLALSARRRQKGDPLTVTLMAIGRAVYYGMVTGKHLTYEQMAALAGVCVETVRRCIIYLEAAGVFGVLNRMVRLGRDLVRGANLYLAPWAIDVATAADNMTEFAKGRVKTFTARCADLLGLAVRAFGVGMRPLSPPGSGDPLGLEALTFGLNKTPLRAADT